MQGCVDEAKKNELVAILTNELKVLRARAGISQKDLAERIGVSRQTYGAIENQKQKMTWNTFLSLLFLFLSNEDTVKMINLNGAYPPELESYIKMQDIVHGH